MSARLSTAAAAASTAAAAATLTSSQPATPGRLSAAQHPDLPATAVDAPASAAADGAAPQPEGTPFLRTGAAPAVGADAAAPLAPGGLQGAVAQGSVESQATVGLGGLGGSRAWGAYPAGSRALTDVGGDVDWSKMGLPTNAEHAVRLCARRLASRMPGGLCAGQAPHLLRPRLPLPPCARRCRRSSLAWFSTACTWACAPAR